MFALAVGVYQIQTNPISTFAQAEHQEPCNRRSSQSTTLRQYLQLTQHQKLTAETSWVFAYLCGNPITNILEIQISISLMRVF
jgi:hypothetical protein